MTNLGKSPNLIKNYIKEIKENMRFYDKKPNSQKISKMHKIVTQMKKYLQFNNDRWQQSIQEISEEIEKDTSYTRFLKLEKAIKERIKTCLVINVINFSICSSSNTKSIYEDKLSKENAKKIIKKFKTSKPSKNKQIIVNEDDFSFSDDSLDYSISPIPLNTKPLVEVQRLEEIISKAKSETELKNLIRKSCSKNPTKLKCRLEVDMKSLLLMMKCLNISS
jgi:hypothetical protein